MRVAEASGFSYMRNEAAWVEAGAEGTFLSTDEQGALREYVVLVGVVRAHSRLKVATEPITRAIAGLPVRRGTIIALRAGLAAIAAEARGRVALAKRDAT